MTAAVLRLEGGARLRRTLKQAGDDLEDLKGAHAAAVAIVVPRARGAAPHRSGRLAGSVRGSGTKTQAVIRAGGAAVPYAGPIHWGWPARHIEAQPFIVEQAQATEPAWSEVYMAAVNRAIAQIKGIS